MYFLSDFSPEISYHNFHLLSKSLIKSLSSVGACAVITVKSQDQRRIVKTDSL
jgi:hypothetical protein